MCFWFRNSLCVVIACFIFGVVRCCCFVFVFASINIHVVFACFVFCAFALCVDVVVAFVVVFLCLNVLFLLLCLCCLFFPSSCVGLFSCVLHSFFVFF